MGLKINYNVSAMIANNSLKTADNKLSASLERLSSGYKINHAKDNAAGLAIARRMNAQVRGLSVAEQDAKDGESVVEIADGAMAEVHDMLQRMNELAVKASNGTMSDDDRVIIQDEIKELQNEITRIGETTEYNSQKLFDGTFDLKGYCLNNNNIKINYYSDEVNTGKYDVTLKGIKFNEKGKVELDQDTETTLVRTDLAQPKDISVSVSGDSDQLILSGENGVEVRLDISAHIVKNADGTYTFNDIVGADTLKLDMTGIGAMTLQIGANEGQTIDLRIPQLSLQQIGIDKRGHLVQLRKWTKQLQLFPRCVPALAHTRTVCSIRRPIWQRHRKM